MTSKFIRPVLIILSIVLIIVSIKLNNQMFLCGAGLFWISVGLINYSIERSKRSKAVYITFNKSKTAINYVLLIALILSNYFVFTDTHSPGRGAVTIFLAVALVATALLSRLGEHYYLFDHDGIKTLGERLDYAKITDRRTKEKVIEFDTDENRNEMVIRKSLLTPDIIHFLETKIKLPEVTKD